MGDPRLLRVAQKVEQFDTPELHALIADLFETMHAANGAGLGLSIVQTVALHLGGRIELGNRPEGGACARLGLPVLPGPG